MFRVGAVGYDLTRQAAALFSRVRCARLGAALAFYVTLSLAPLLLIVIGIAGLAFGDTAARGEVLDQIRDLVGQDGAQVVENLLASSRSAGGGVVSTVVGFVTLLVGATGVFAQLQEALDTVWEVPERKTSGLGVVALVRDRLLSFSLVCGLAFLLLVSLVASAAMSGFQGWLSACLGAGAYGLGVLNVVLSLVLSAVLFGFIFKVLPHARLRWADVWVGAVVTSALFNLGKHLIGLYLGTAAVGSPFGAAGSFVVLLVWIYYSTQLLLFGAAFTRVYVARFGSEATPGDIRGRAILAPAS